MQWATDGHPSAIEDVSIDHCRFHILVAEDFLDGADVIVDFQEVGGKAVAKRMTGQALVDYCQTDSSADGFL